MASRFNKRLGNTYLFFAGKNYSIFPNDGFESPKISVSPDDFGLYDFVGVWFRLAAALCCAPCDGGTPLAIVGFIIGIVDAVLRNVFATAATIVASPVILAVDIYENSNNNCAI